MAVERIAQPGATDDSGEVELENTLRPKNFNDYIGQERLKKALKLAIVSSLGNSGFLKTGASQLTMCCFMARLDLVKLPWPQ